MSPKQNQHEVGSSSSSKPLNVANFSSYEAFDRFESLLPLRGGIKEQSFVNPGGRVEEIINSRGWQLLTKQPDLVVIPLIKEFYANGPYMMGDNVFVWSKYVSIMPEVINDFYRTPNIEDDGFSLFMKFGPDYEEIILMLAIPGTIWKRKEGTIYHFPAFKLNVVSRAWHFFISAKLLSSGHLSEVTPPRATLNFAIQNDYTIDVGQLIYKNLLSLFKRSSKVGLGYCSLIFGLCKKPGVKTTSA